MIRTKQIVINGLGHTHYAALITNLLHIFADLIAGVHRVVAAVIEEITHVVLLEDIQNALVIRIVHIRVRNLVPAGTQGRGGGVEQQLQLACILGRHIKQPVVEHALDPVLRTINLGDRLIVQRCPDHAICTGIDNGSGTA